MDRPVEILSVADLHHPTSRCLDAARVGRFFGLSLPALAKALGWSPDALQNAPADQRLHDGLAPLARIATSLISLFGTAENARVWMNAPHPELDGLAPLDLVKANSAVVVADLLEDALLGHPA
jgi:hypothetical protein